MAVRSSKHDSHEAAPALLTREITEVDALRKVTRAPRNGISFDIAKLLIASKSAHSEVTRSVRSRARDPAAFASRAHRENLFVELSLRAMLAAPSLSRLEPQGMVRPPGRNVAKSTRHRRCFRAGRVFSKIVLAQSLRAEPIGRGATLLSPITIRDGVRTYRHQNDAIGAGVPIANETRLTPESLQNPVIGSANPQPCG